jgi:hypothetical protein
MGSVRDVPSVRSVAPMSRRESGLEGLDEWEMNMV